MTVAETIARARKALLAAGVPADEAPGDAEILARHTLGWDLTQLALHRSDSVPALFEEAFAGLIARRARREPVSQILGQRAFWGLDFEVTRDVLTPRPETELVVQAALDVCAQADAPTAQPLIMDVGTGSGCIAIALATELPGARFIASDTSAAALDVARRNAARHGVTGRIAFRHTSLIPPDAAADIIASNPPYVPLSDRPSLAPEVRDYEPEQALFGGEDGLDFHRRLFETAASGLGLEGRMIVEVGYDQAERVKALGARHSWCFERGYRDLQGIERVLVFKVRNR